MRITLLFVFTLISTVQGWAADPTEEDRPHFDAAEPWEVCPGGELREEVKPTPGCGFNDAGVPKPGTHLCGPKPPSCAKHCQLVECLPNP